MCSPSACKLAVTACTGLSPSAMAPLTAAAMGDVSASVGDTDGEGDNREMTVRLCLCCAEIAGLLPASLVE